MLLVLPLFFKKMAKHKLNVIRSQILILETDSVSYAYLIDVSEITDEYLLVPNRDRVRAQYDNQSY